MKARKQRTHFVPKVVYQTAFAGVVPLCVASLACSSSSSSGGSSGPQLTVACGGFCGAVAQAAFIDAGDAASDAPASGDAAAESTDFCSVNFCGVGVAAFVDSGDSGDTG
jgi:hypothetical protein